MADKAGEDVHGPIGLARKTALRLYQPWAVPAATALTARVVWRDELTAYVAGTAAEHIGVLVLGAQTPSLVAAPVHACPRAGPAVA